MNITFYHRFPCSGHFSIEGLFREIRKALPNDIYYSVATSRFESKGFLRRFYNTIEAFFRQGDINHITGDVHYLIYFLRRKRTLLTIHDCSSLERLKGIKKKIFFLIWFWLPEKRSTLISVISDATKRELLRYLRCNPNKIRIVPDCVSSFFRPSPRMFNTKKPNILQIGTRHNKNLLRVAKALKGIPCHLMIVGELSRQQEEFLNNCNIDYSAAANISDEKLLEMYRQCDMLVFASTYEGFGLPIIEANAVGRPVITGNILSMPEVAGNAACLVDPFNVESIRDGILRVIQDAAYREQLVQNGFKNVERFKPEVVAMQYVTLYKELLNRQKIV